MQTITERDLLAYYERVKCDMDSVRSGLSDAAHLIDAISNDIIYENCPNRRNPYNGIMNIILCLNRSAEAVRAMRDKIPNSDEYRADDKKD